MKKKIISILEKSLKVLSKDDLNLNECLQILNEILYEWRLCYIKFMEVRIKREIQIEKPIELPEDVKEKISESISKTLEEDIR